MIHRKLPLIVVFLLVGPETGNLQEESLSDHSDAVSVPPDFTMELLNKTEISLEALDNITIVDKIANITCEWGSSSCYVECANVSVPVNYSGKANLTNATDAYGTYKITAGDIAVGLLECELTKCEVDPFTALLRRTQIQHLEGLKDLKRVLNMKSMCHDVFHSSEVKQAYIEVEKVLIMVVLDLPFKGQEITHHLQDLAVKVIKMNLSSPNVTGDHMHIGAPELSQKDLNYTPQIYIPTKIIQNISEEKRKVAVVVYKNPDQFLKEEKLQSILIRVELPDDNLVRKMEIPFEMSFRTFDLSKYTGKESCPRVPVLQRARSPPVASGVILPQTAAHAPVFTEDDNGWVLTVHGQVSYDASHRLLAHSYSVEIENLGITTRLERAGKNVTWSKQGCNTRVDGQKVLCTCDHMTPFGVLMVPAQNIDQNAWKMLSVISAVGAGLSAFFTAVSILTHVILRRPSQEHSSSIHASLSGALLLLNSSFLLNEWLANMRIEALCTFIGMTMHYGLLCSFTWMAIEALHLYLLIVRVFNTYIRLYITKLTVIGWGLPAVVMAVSFAAKSKPNLFYGLQIITVGDTTSSLCWITDLRYFYGLNITYFALIFLFNNGILLTVSVRICHMKSVDKKTGLTLPWKQVSTVLGLTCLLGSTWGLAFLSYGPLTIPMQYLFCIFNSLQGFFIFLWMCRTSRKEESPVSSKSST